MIVYYDIFNNMIKISRKETKKLPAYYFEQYFDFSLLSLENRLKATTMFLSLDETKEMKKDKVNQIVFSDDILGFGIFELPNLKKQNLRDVFDTQFRLYYSNNDNYYYDGYEVSRDDKNVLFQYEFAKREFLNRIILLFRNSDITISDKNVFASTFTIVDKDIAPYPEAYLIVGAYASEIIIVKGDKIVSINIIPYGSIALLDDKQYIHSAYNMNNEKSLKFAGFIKNHIANQLEVTDFNIDHSDPSEGMNIIEPKELRLLKDSTLSNYTIRNNFRKFYVRLLEILEIYHKEPWFFPLKDINVIADIDVIGYLIDVSAEYNGARFVALGKTVNDYMQNGIRNNPMYSKGIKKERKKFDWKAFLNTDLGGKKG